MHVHGRKGFSGQVRNPITELIVTRHDYATILTVEGMANWKKRHSSCHRIWVGPGDIYHITGREHIAIHAQAFFSRLLVTAAPSDMHHYLSPATSGVQLGQGHPPGYLPVSPMTVFHSVSAPLFSPP